MNPKKKQSIQFGQRPRTTWSYFRPFLIGLVIGIVAVIFQIKYEEYYYVKNALIKPDFNPKKPPVYEPRPTTPQEKKEVEYKIPIIMYHYVEYAQDPNDTIRKSLTINPNVFDAEAKALKDSEYVTYFVRDLPDVLSGKMPYDKKSVVLTFDDGYEDFYTYVLPILKKYNLKATLYVINNYVGRRGFLTKDEIREIIRSGLVEIGSHTLDHVYLKTVSRQVAERQIRESKLRLEDEYGIRVETFAYPFGSFNPETIDLVKEASFSAAVTTLPGTYHVESSSHYLTRVRAGAFSGANIVKVLESYKK